MSPIAGSDVTPLVRSARPAGSKDVCAIAVMAKASSPGRTKTRLAPPLTLEQASDLNSVFLADIAQNVSSAGERARIACYMAFGPPESVAFFEQHMPPEVGLVEAWQPNFGDCLCGALAALLDLGYGAAVVLNSDSPTLPTAVLVETAERLLEPGERLVLGPSTDGGYYLLGVKQAHRRLFEDIAWSTDRVFEQTCQRAREIGLDTVLLPPWYDVDDAASLQCLIRETLGGARFSAAQRSHAAPHTTAFLNRCAREDRLPLIAATLPATNMLPSAHALPAAALDGPA
jgi:rSAM/selenodomain-associated transferase 1